MPGRWACFAIVLFWLGMTAWLAGREIWLRFGSEPRFQDALAASATGETVHWLISENDKPIGEATTRVVRERPSGHYQLQQTLRLKQFFGIPVPFKYRSQVTVNLFGDLHRLWMRFELPGFAGELRGQPMGEGMPIKAVVTSGTKLLFEQEFRVPIDGRDLVLNSICPFDRLPGLHLGQRWTTNLVDPMSVSASLDGFSGVLDRPATRVRVLDEIHNLHWNGEWEPCFVVESKQGNLHMQVWVRESDGVVLKQTGQWGGRSLELTRKQTTPAAAGGQDSPAATELP